MSSRRFIVLSSVVLSTACPATTGPASAPTSSAAANASAASARPRLVVSIVLDQLGSWVLQKHRPQLPKDGLLARAMAEGAYYPVARYPYAATITAAGHATLYTGALPRDHGVTANDVYDYERKGKRALVDDGRHAVFGTDGFAGPSVLLTETVGDALKRQTAGRAKVVSISIKDRGAVLPAGKKADAAVFYDKRVPGFTTSSYYAKTMPGWLSRWRDAHPVDDYLAPWTPLPQTAASPPGPDDRPVEARMGDFGRAFPHDPSVLGAQKYSVFRVTPASTRYQLDLTEALIEQFALGADDTPDLLAISISATDYVGHAFGAESWEYLDNLLRTDRWLTELVDGLAAETSVAVLITSDHGQAPLSVQPPSPFIVPRALLKTINAQLTDELGADHAPYVVGYYIPYVYVGPKVLASPDKDKILDAIVAQLAKRDDVHLAVRTEVAARWPEETKDDLRRAVGLSVRPGVGGQIFVVPAEKVIVDPEMGGGGTTHGTPWAYDREVPVIMYGAGVTKTGRPEAMDIRQVAPTLAALLGIEAPSGATHPPLDGAVR